MKKIKIMESVLMLVTVVVLVWLILEEKKCGGIFFRNNTDSFSDY